MSPPGERSPTVRRRRRSSTCGAPCANRLRPWRVSARPGRAGPCRGDRRASRGDRSPGGGDRAGRRRATSAPGCCSSSAVRCTTADALTDACAAFRRGLDELDAVGGQDTELGVELEGGYLNAALFAPTVHVDAHRRADGDPGRRRRTDERSRARAAEQGDDAGSCGRAGRATSVVGRGAPPAQRRAADGAGCGRHPGPVASDRHAGLVRRLRRARTRRCAWRSPTPDVAGPLLAYVLACVFRSRHALWTGPIGDAMHDARAALELSPPHSVYLCSAAYCLVSGLLEQGEEDEAEAVLALRRPAAAGAAAVLRRLAADGRRAARRAVEASMRPRWTPSWPPGDTTLALGIVNPAVLPWRSEAGLAA